MLSSNFMLSIGIFSSIYLTNFHSLLITFLFSYLYKRRLLTAILSNKLIIFILFIGNLSTDHSIINQISYIFFDWYFYLYYRLNRFLLLLRTFLNLALKIFCNWNSFFIILHFNFFKILLKSLGCAIKVNIWCKKYEFIKIAWWNIEACFT